MPLLMDDILGDKPGDKKPEKPAGVKTLDELAPRYEQAANTWGVPDQKTSSVRTLDTIAPVVSSGVSVRPGLSRYYEDHPKLAGRSPEFRALVADLDSKLDLKSAVQIIEFGAQEQQHVGELVSAVSGLTSKIVSLGLPAAISTVLEIIKGFDARERKSTSRWSFDMYPFSSAPKEVTIGDLIALYTECEPHLQAAAQAVRDGVAQVKRICADCDALLAQHKTLSRQLEACEIAGEIVLERQSKAMFTEHQTATLNDQFQRRIQDMKTFHHMMDLALEQTKIVQKSTVTQVMDAQSIIDTTIPVWRTSFTTLLAKWQAAGVPNNTPVSRIQDVDFQVVVDSGRQLATNLQGALNAVPSV